jgi:tRNA-2-methylthio-N6-dimethylallyladenosine synthase
MGRDYTAAEYLALVDRIRHTLPDVVLTTDIICGFCSESDDEFQATCRLVEQVQFDSAYIFKYSERKNTIAARKYTDDVPDQVKGQRVYTLVEIQRAITAERNRRYIGKAMEVLVEGDATRSSSQTMGKTDGNITVVWDKSTGDFEPGTLTTRRIFDASAATLYGKC